MTKVSIIIPLYNQEEYVEKCLSSLRRQTFPHFEAIIIDDGSTDNSAKVASAFLNDSRFRLIHQENAGVSAARNNGMNHANGEWLCFVDPDDYVKPDYLETLVKATYSKKSAQIIMSSCLLDKNDGKLTPEFFFPSSFSAHNVSEKTPLFHQLMDGHYQQKENAVTAIGVPWGKLYNRKWVESEHLSFDPALKRMQDNIFNMEAFFLADSLQYLDYAGYIYRVESLTSRAYEKIAQGAYHPALIKRIELMNKYKLLSNEELSRACDEERTNILFQEYKANTLLSDIQPLYLAKSLKKSVSILLQTITVKQLTFGGKIRYYLMRYPILFAFFANFTFKKHAK
ncbi:glycosyltransferase family 2 protein [Bifidobacterium choloepi]|uniref:Glycosyltransferase n=1 Tax=Bifidobacterium choloepi TaxID=2614131 RepID=A0A6I5N963_9BIFI|nr:glycosyltransferase family 2 protein [Bifidobacterium choloepi]NEG70351.1 glycosyltransferase [Bifidobacterium choloepi]